MNKPCPGIRHGIWALRIDGRLSARLGTSQPTLNCIFLPHWKEPQGMIQDAQQTLHTQCVSTGSHSDVKGSAQMGTGNKRVMLDLCCGTKSVGDDFEQNSYEVISLDISPQYEPTILVDIMTWDYRNAFPQGHFDVIFCSPPCTQFSRALTRAPRDIETADKIVQKVLEIIAYFKPQKWFLENPRNVLLKDRPYMHDISFWGY